MQLYVSENFWQLYCKDCLFLVSLAAIRLTNHFEALNYKSYARTYFNRLK